ncbi:hypothetical protein LJY25_08590 [Hymenobacter sp. BT175]|uniref:hypothetical protein n=1 Tax=Hymenobacter translucens TaxID=2886507 RepID=UPI001D0E7F1F|nr:hypothetical protein [Hymenobacter translucens]MCC2546498.1 hypothetical protein [Hymenobacter translucens]
MSRYKALVALLLACCLEGPTARAQGAVNSVLSKPGLTYGYCSLAYLDPRVETPIHGLSELPDSIQRRLRDHLVKRLGPAFYARLVPAGGRRIDLEKLAEIDAAEKTARRWVVCSYYLCFTLRDEPAGIGSYVAQIGLDAAGRVVEEITLPDIVDKPGKAKLIALSRLQKLARNSGLQLVADSARRLYATRALTYRPQLNSLVWTVTNTRYSADDTPMQQVLTVDAHSGAILKKRRHRVLLPPF